MITKLKNKRLEELNKLSSLVTKQASRTRLPRRLAQLVLSLAISGLALALVLGLFLFSARQIQAAPSIRPLAAPGSIVTHTAVGSATHQMTVFGNGQLTNQFLTDNAIRTNQIGARISHTTIAVLFDQHTGNSVDVGSQLEFVETTPIFTGPSTISGFYEQSYGVYTSQSPSPSYQITQRTLITSANNCVIMELTISNTGVISLTGGRLLYMMDIQVGEQPNGDVGGFDPVRQMVYQTDYNGSTRNGYAFGIALLSGDLQGYAVQDDSYLDPALDIELRNEMITPTNAINDGNDDVSWLVVNIPTLSPAQSTYLAFNLCARTAASESEALNEMNDTFDGVSSLSAVKTSDPASGSPIQIDDLITYTIAVVSTGSWYVDNIVLTDTIPGETDLITYSVTQGSITASAQLVTATIGRLYPASDTVTVTIVVDPQDSAFGGETFITNRAFIDSQSIITQSNIVTHNPTVLTITKHSTGNWARRTKLTFSNTPVTPLDDFPVLVKLDSSRIDYTQTQNVGEDLRFVDPNGTVLSYEIEEWNESGDSYVWVKVPRIDSTTDYIWMYYGNNTAPDGQSPADVWDSAYTGVWHLNEAAVDGMTTTIHHDSTANDNDGVQHLNNSTVGQMAGGQYFSSATDPPTDTEYIKISGLLGQPTQLTLSAWVQLFSATSGADVVSLGDIVAIRADENRWGGAGGFYYDGSGWQETGSTQLIAGTGWHHLVYTYTANSQRFYIDGVELAATNHGESLSYIGPEAGTDTYIGTHGTLRDYLDFANGTIDEVRVSSVVRSSGWITAQYQSMVDNLITFGNAEDVNVTGIQAIAGLPVTYTLTVSNSGPGDTTSVLVTDALPTGANHISGGTLVGGDTVSWTVPSIAGDTAVLQSFVVSTCQLSLVNDSYQVVSSTQRVTSGLGDPLITLLAAPSIDAGFNTNPVTVSINSPVAFTSTSTTNGGPLVDWSWNFGDGYGGSGSTTSHIFTTAGNYTVTLTVTDTCGYADTITDTVSFYIPNLTLTKQVDSSTVQPDSQLTYTLIMTNTGPSAATNVIVTDTIPANTSFVSATLPHTGPVGGVITWPLGTLDIDETGSVTMVVLIDSDVVSGTYITNTAWLTSQQQVTDTDTVTTLVGVGAADLSIAKTADPYVVNASNSLTYTLTISNSGPGAATGITATDTLPAGVIYGGANGSGWSCSHNSGVVTCTRSSLSVGISPNIVITVTAPITGGTIVNTAEVTATVADLNLTNNITTTDVLVIADTDLQVSKTVTPVSAVPGQPITYTLTFTNNGISPVSDVIITDIIPLTLTNLSVDNSGASIVPTGGVSYTWQVVDLLPGSGGIITVTGIISPDIVNDTIVVNQGFITTTTFVVDTLPDNNRSTVTTTIRLPRVSFDQANYSISEDAGTAFITATLDTLPFVTTTVSFQTSDGTATAPLDYGPASGTLVFNPGFAASTFTVAIVDDAVYEGAETVNLTLSNADGAIISGANPASLIITDDETEPTVSIVDVTVTEGDLGTTNAVFTVTLSGESAFTTTVNYTTENGTAVEPGDYVTGTGTITFSPGITTQYVTILINGDTLYEATENFMVNLADAVNSTIVDSQSVGTIFDNDSAPEVEFTAAIQNGSEGVGVLTVTVVMDAVSGLDVTVPFNVTGTATGGVDYSITGSPVVISADLVSTTVLITVTDDALDEADETVIVTMNSPSNATLGTTTVHSATILDDDPLPEIGFDSASYTVDEGAGTATITITLNAASGRNVGVTYATSNGTAQAGNDYAATGSTLTFGAGTTELTFTVPITDDLLSELDETVNLALNSPVNGTLGVYNPATLTIIDDDIPVNVNIVKVGPSTAAVDQTIIYSFTVSTNMTVTTVTVTDTIAGLATLVSGDDNGNSMLEPGENWIYTASYEITPFDPLYLQNTGYVSAIDIYGNNVSATDTHTTNISFAPGLLIQKTGPAVARVGDTVVYDIIVTNATTNTFFSELGALSIGDGSPITITQVTDSLGPVTYIGGDNGDSQLSGTEQWTYRITHTIVSSIPNPLFSQASVEGRDMENDVITDTDTMNTYIDTTIYFDIFLPVILKN